MSNRDSYSYRAAIVCFVLAACSGPTDVQCLTDADCSRLPGGRCAPASTGHNWCAYADTACPSGERWSDRDVGDGLSGACVGSDPNGDAGVDAPLACVADTITCETDTYIECSSTGEAVRSLKCPLGCDVGAARCIDVNPSNGLAAQLDLASEGPVVVLTGITTILSTATNGQVITGGGNLAVPTEVVNGIRVFRFKTLEVQGLIDVQGTHAIAFVVDGDVTIRALIDVSARGTTAGAGRYSGTCVGGKAVSGGGGGGGGRFDDGAPGGSGNGNPGGLGGAAERDIDLDPLIGGCAGGGWGTIQVPGVPGGGGGGAIQIVSRTVVAFLGSGGIDASGGGGGSGGTAQTTGPTPGNGGGSGGAVLIEAPQIVLDGVDVVISTKGGGGGASTPQGQTRPGSDGGITSAPAAGGTYAGYSSGGLGGIAGQLPGAGSSDSILPGGGGGGSVGEARFNNATGAAIDPQNGAAIYSRRTTGTLATRLVP